MSTPTTRAECEALDRTDPLRRYRDAFDIPNGLVYLDGNSLGALPRTAADRVERLVRQEWGQRLIRSWNEAGWFDKPRVLGDRIAPLVGAGPGEVVVGDSTSVALFKVVVSALWMRPGRRVIVSEQDNFPTDLYMLEGVAALMPGCERRLVREDGPALAEVLDGDVAVVVLTHVNYRTGAMYDMAEVTRQVHDAGALMVWDLCHSVGAVPVDLHAAGADLAVGCTYKYLNGGPGSPAFLFVATRHQEAARQPLSGWHGHARPFDFVAGYEPAPGITRFITGTPPLVSYAALEASLEMWTDVDLAELRAKSVALTELFIELVDERCAGSGVEVASPRDAAQRGSQVALRHTQGYAVMQALIARGVVGDFRAPDLMRFGFAPLYVGYTDVWDAVAVLHDVLAREVFREKAYQQRAAVT